MANTLGILSIFVLGFALFVAYKNKEEHETQIQAVKVQNQNFDRNQSTFNGLVEDIKDLDQETVEANAERDDFQGKLDEQNGKNDAVAKDISAKESELKETKDRVAKAEDTLKDLGGMKELAPKIDRLNASIAELDDQVAVLNAEISQLRGAKSAAEAAEAQAKKTFQDLNAGRSLADMRTTIRSVDSALGIITLNAGIKQGVIGGSKVDVMRNGEKIAEMRVTSVVANTSAASVIQASLAEGEQVRAGDAVVPSKEGGQ